MNNEYDTGTSSECIFGGHAHGYFVSITLLTISFGYWYHIGDTSGNR